jgi:16S rRNA C967 or C1407 C5-methylase (RsmB/RsmF family)/NOL1/NOP2/fmu family ribosome biogenesis protein
MSNLPQEFLDIMHGQLGDQSVDFVSSLNKPSPTSIRLNPEKNYKVHSDSSVLWSAFGKYLSSRPSFTLDPAFHGGAYYVQEPSSMFLEQAFVQVLDSGQSLNILDLSAAPGGKSTHMLSLAGRSSLLVSNEVIRSRATILAENILKWGYPNAIVTNNDPKDFGALGGFFDVVVIDAPCSGEGMFRKDPKAVDEWSPAHVSLCSSRQKRIIADVWPSLKENGILVYCTCTYNREENEENLQWLRQQHKIEFIKLKIDPQWGIEQTDDDGVVGYRFYPHRVAGEGFFISVMRKTESQSQLRSKIKKRLVSPAKKSIQSLQPWIEQPDRFRFFEHQEIIRFFPELNIDSFETVLQNLTIIQAGIPAVTVKHDKLIPEHGLALSIDLATGNFKQLSLTREEAIQYLRRESPAVHELEKGYHLVMFENVAIGWINSLGNRINNLYPLDWRIRMAVPK